MYNAFKQGLLDNTLGLLITLVFDCNYSCDRDIIDQKVFLWKERLSSVLQFDI